MKLMPYDPDILEMTHWMGDINCQTLLLPQNVHLRSMTLFYINNIITTVYQPHLRSMKWIYNYGHYTLQKKLLYKVIYIFFLIYSLSYFSNAPVFWKDSSLLIFFRLPNYWTISPYIYITESGILTVLDSEMPKLYATGLNVVSNQMKPM